MVTDINLILSQRFIEFRKGLFSKLIIYLVGFCLDHKQGSLLY